MNAIFNNDTPKVKLEKIIATIDCMVTRYGLNPSTVEKSKTLCPDLLEKALILADRMDTEFSRSEEKLKDSEHWNEFVRAFILPSFMAWLEIVFAVNGNLNISDETADLLKRFRSLGGSK